MQSIADTQTTVHDHDAHGLATGPHHWRIYIPGQPAVCSFCGSITPGFLALVLTEGGKLDPADGKYGWPHKYYVTHPTYGWSKFYTVHLQDAPEAIRTALERRMGISFNFVGNVVTYEPFSE